MATATGLVWDRHQTDEDDYVDVGIDGVDDLSQVTSVHGEVAFKLGAVVELVAAVVDVAERVVRVQLSPWLAAAAQGDWRFVVVIEFTGGVGPLTWPERGHNTIRVHGPV